MEHVSTPIEWFLLHCQISSRLLFYVFIFNEKKQFSYHNFLVNKVNWIYLYISNLNVLPLIIYVLWLKKSKLNLCKFFFKPERLSSSKRHTSLFHSGRILPTKRFYFLARFFFNTSESSFEGMLASAWFQVNILMVNTRLKRIFLTMIYKG